MKIISLVVATALFGDASASKTRMKNKLVQTPFASDPYYQTALVQQHSPKSQLVQPTVPSNNLMLQVGSDERIRQLMAPIVKHAPFMAQVTASQMPPAQAPLAAPIAPVSMVQNQPTLQAPALTQGPLGPPKALNQLKPKRGPGQTLPQGGPPRAMSQAPLQVRPPAPARNLPQAPQQAAQQAFPQAPVQAQPLAPPQALPQAPPQALPQAPPQALPQAPPQALSQAPPLPQAQPQALVQAPLAPQPVVAQKLVQTPGPQPVAPTLAQQPGCDCAATAAKYQIAGHFEELFKKMANKQEIDAKNEETYADIIKYVKIDEDGDCVADHQLDFDPARRDKPSVTPSPEENEKFAKDIEKLVMPTMQVQGQPITDEQEDEIFRIAQDQDLSEQDKADKIASVVSSIIHPRKEKPVEQAKEAQKAQRAQSKKEEESQEKDSDNDSESE